MNRAARYACRQPGKVNHAPGSATLFRAVAESQSDDEVAHPRFAMLIQGIRQPLGQPQRALPEVGDLRCGNQRLAGIFLGPYTPHLVPIVGSREDHAREGTTALQPNGARPILESPVTRRRDVVELVDKGGRQRGCTRAARISHTGICRLHPRVPIRRPTP